MSRWTLFCAGREDVDESLIGCRGPSHQERSGWGGLITSREGSRRIGLGHRCFAFEAGGYRASSPVS